MPVKRIEGWKDIARYLGRSERWCRDHSDELPVTFWAGRWVATSDELEDYLATALAPAGNDRQRTAPNGKKSSAR